MWNVKGQMTEGTFVFSGKVAAKFTGHQNAPMSLRRSPSLQEVSQPAPHLSNSTLHLKGSQRMGSLNPRLINCEVVNQTKFPSDQ